MPVVQRTNNYGATAVAPNANIPLTALLNEGTNQTRRYSRVQNRIQTIGRDLGKAAGYIAGPAVVQKVVGFGCKKLFGRAVGRAIGWVAGPALGAYLGGSAAVIAGYAVAELATKGYELFTRKGSSSTTKQERMNGSQDKAESLFEPPKVTLLEESNLTDLIQESYGEELFKISLTQEP